MTESSKQLIDLSKIIISCSSAKCTCERERCVKHNLQHCGNHRCSMCKVQCLMYSWPMAEQKRIPSSDLVPGTCGSGKCPCKRETCAKHSVLHCSSVVCFACVMLLQEELIEKPIVEKPKVLPKVLPIVEKKTSPKIGIQTCGAGNCTCRRKHCTEHNVQLCGYDQCVMCKYADFRASEKPMVEKDLTPKIGIQTCGAAVCTCSRKLCSKHYIKHCGYDQCIKCEIDVDKYRVPVKPSSSPNPASRHVA